MPSTNPSDALPRLMIRLPLDVKKWLEKQSRKNASSQASEVVRSCRERMEREAASHAR